MSVVVNWEQIYHPPPPRPGPGGRVEMSGDAIEMLLNVTAWECYWHEVVGGHGCYLTSGQAQPSPPTPNKELSGPRSQ